MRTSEGAKRKISTDQALKRLRKNGIDATEKDAEIVLDFLHF
jgi:hypothetical protein